MTTSKGGRPATGSIQIVGGKPFVFVTLGGTKHRPRYRLFVDGEDAVALAGHVAAFLKAKAAGALEGSTELEKRAIQVSARARNENLVSEGTGETVSEWLKKFHAHKGAKGLSSVGEMKGRAKNWVAPTIGNIPMVGVTRADLERVVLRLDKAIEAYNRHGRGKGRLSPSSAANVWGDLAHAFDAAVNAKDPALRVLDLNPARGVAGPETGDEREGPILYSDEIVTLLGGKAVDPDAKDVPLYRRRAYAGALYTKTRGGELGAIEQADVDLAHQTIAITKQIDRKSGKKKTTKRTKTKRVRTIDIEPHLLPLIEHLMKHPDGKGGRLFHMPPREDWAELLRKDLWTVGVRRSELHTEDASRTKIWFHHLRDTGLTHMAVRGDHPTVIQWTAGHTDFKTTEGYISRGRVEARRIGAPLPPLPPSILEGSGSAIRGRSRALEGDETCLSQGLLATPMGIESRPTISPEREKQAPSSKGDGPKRSETLPALGVPEASRDTSGEHNEEPSDAEIERAMVAAMLDDRGAVAEMLARRLKARQLARAGVPLLADRTRRG